MIRRLTVFEVPVAKARPRVAVRNGKAHGYTPTKTQQAEWQIRQAWMAQHGAVPATGPVGLVVTAFLKMPSSMPKKRRLTAQPTPRPDIDNYIKTVLDALNGVAFLDDSQVVHLIAQKAYVRPSLLLGLPDEAALPRWEIAVEDPA